MSSEKKQGYVFPAGTYNLKIIDHALTKNESTGNTILRMKCEVVSFDKGQPAPAKPIDFTKKAFVDMFFTDKTRQRTFDFLKAAGFNGSSIAQLDESASKQLNKPFISLAGFEFRGPNNPNKSPKDGFIYNKFGAWPIKDGSSWKSNAKPANIGSFENLDNIWGSVASSSAVKVESKVEKKESSDDGFDWNN